MRCALSSSRTKIISKTFDEVSCCISYTFCSCIFGRAWKSPLAGGDVQADGAWVEVLEVGEGRAVRRLHFKGDRLACGAAELGDGVGVARCYRGGAIIGRDAGGIGVGC